MPMSSFEARKARLIFSVGWPPARTIRLKSPLSRWRNFGMAWSGLRGTHRVKRQHYLQTILAPFPIIPYTEQTAYEHARIWAELEAAGKMIGFYDVIVAATALERGCEVATFNQRHFTQVKGLVIIEPK
jgi:predicted nucleic acid-binding protein